MTQPDLFALGERRTEPALVSSRPVLLPEDLASLLRLLTDEDLERLRVAVVDEVARRTLAPASTGDGQRDIAPSKATPAARPTQTWRKASLSATSTVTAGKASAIRAAFRAGLKPATIARQFGVTQSLVRQVLQGEGRS
jgi:hypothetical protein